jgi:DNA polymerase III delta' subunit
MAWSRIDGQPLAVRILSAHVRRARLPAAYLFAGPDGAGKQRLALEYAQAINCEAPGEGGACGACRMCGQIQRGVCPDVHVLQPGATGSIKLDDARAAFERILLRPFAARYQVAIILQADCLTDEAANSLLKTLEEPPSGTRFVLTTVEPRHCLPTIVSRCHLVRFQPPRQPPQPWEHAHHLASHDATTWLGWSQPEQRQELAQWIARSVWWLRDLSVASVDPTLPMHHADQAGAIQQRAGQVDRRRCLDAGLKLVELWESLEQMANPRLVAASFREQWLGLVAPERSR